MTRNFYLDDLRIPPDGWELFKTVGDVVDALMQYECDNLSLDNDLGIQGLENEGQSVVYRLVKMQEEDGKDFWPKETITIHSGNTVGKDNMVKMLERYSPFERMYSFVHTHWVRKR